MHEEEEKDLEIGYPTDVKHLTHIGWDGSTTISNATKGWENLTPSEIISFPSISLKQFEVAMAQQASSAATTGDVKQVWYNSHKGRYLGLISYNYRLILVSFYSLIWLYIYIWDEKGKKSLFMFLVVWISTNLALKILEWLYHCM